MATSGICINTINNPTNCYLISAGTLNSATSAETNLFAGATGSPALTTLSGLLGFPIPANTLRTGRVMKLKLFGVYSTVGATATITPAIYFNTSVSSVKIGNGIASGTFSTTGASSFTYEAIMYMLDSVTIVTGGSTTLNNEDPVTTTATALPDINPSLKSLASGTAINPTIPGNISASWTGSSANASNNFQLISGSLEFMN
jgi:hypothetical protein